MRAEPDTWALPDAESLERWHYEAIGHLFAEQVSVEPGLTLCVAAALPEPEWSHLGRLRLPAEALPAALDRARASLAARGRPLVVVVTPDSQPSDLEARLRAAGLRPVFAHRWLAWGSGAPPVPRAGPGLSVEEVADAAALEEAVAVFEQVYQGEGLSPGYAAALRRSFGDPAVRHWLARAQGRPVGLASAVRVGPAAALYNLAVLDSARGQGLGRLLTDTRVAWALAQGARAAFLQVERQSVGRWQAAHGLVEVFTARGFAEEVGEEIKLEYA